MIVGPVQLLILQGTPFCNIDCKYCYLPDRLNKKRISIEVINKTIEQLLASNLLGSKLSIIWHAGEPLVVPVEFYVEVIQLVKKLIPPDVIVDHSIQTNATLINQRWCDFFKEFNVKIGVSLDGPKDINDYKRTNRKNQSTFDNVINGIKLLEENKIPFHIISVITSKSLLFPKEIYEFFSRFKIYSLGFNIEEIEGGNQKSSLDNIEVSKESVTRFYQELRQLHRSSGNQFNIRELYESEFKILKYPDTPRPQWPTGQQTRPYGIISVDIDGNFSTFSPELLGEKSELYGDFVLGNVFDISFTDALLSDKFQRIFGDIVNGINKCRGTCEYFHFCGGGTPSNKYFENGSFDSTETMHCKYAIQTPFDVTLDCLERKS